MCAWGMLQERDKAAEELEKLPSQRDMVQVEQQLGSEIAGLERDVQFKTAELKGAQCPNPNQPRKSCVVPCAVLHA